MTEGVTAVVTSCGRHDLLHLTLESFFRHNDHPLGRIIVVEDGPEPAPGLDRYPMPIEAIATGARVGQIAAIDYAYSRITTPYIFHFEDDWEFYRGGFIQASLDVLRRHAACLQLWLRATEDTNQHPLEAPVRHDGAAQWQRLTYDFLRLWHGFSFNPGLRRLSDYRAIQGYGIHTMGAEEWTEERGTREAIIGRVYRDLGHYAGILVDNDGQGYVRHIGWERGVPDLALDRKGVKA